MIGNFADVPDILILIIMGGYGLVLLMINLESR